MIIALMGKKRAGKDYLAQGLIAAFHDMHDMQVERRAFADAMKEMLAQELGVKQCIFHSDAKDHLLFDVISNQLVDEASETTVTVRELLQQYGSSMRAMHGEDIWVDSMLCTMDKDKHYIVTDTRMLNEYKRLKSLGAVFVRVIDPKLKSNDTHVSETELDAMPADYTSINDKSKANMVEIIELSNELMKSWT